MAPFDWKAFMKLKAPDLEEDATKADDMFEVLDEVGNM